MSCSRQTGRTKLYEPGPVSHHHSLLEWWCFFLPHFSPFFTTSLSFLSHSHLLLHWRGYFQSSLDCLRMLSSYCVMDFQGGNCYFAFCPLTSSSFPSLYPLVASQKPIPSHQHTFFSSYTPVSLSFSSLSPSYHYNRTSLHTYMLLLIPPSLFVFVLSLPTGKRKGKNLSVSPVIICNILLLCLWKKLSKWHLTVLAFTFYSNSCKTQSTRGKKHPLRRNLEVSFEILSQNLDPNMDHKFKQTTLV